MEKDEKLNDIEKSKAIEEAVNGNDGFNTVGSDEVIKANLENEQNDIIFVKNYTKDE